MKSNQDLRSDEAQRYRPWYKTKRWQRLRAQQLKREPWCQCPFCKGHRVEAVVVDHIQPHLGDSRKFFNPRNLQSMAKRCHDIHKQRQEKSGAWVGYDVAGNPLDQGVAWHESGGK